MSSNLPSSYSKPPSTHSAPYTPPPSHPDQKIRHQEDQAGSPALYISVLALIIAGVAVYGAFFMERPLSEGQRAALSGIANDLRSLQEREIALSAPVTTTIELNRSYPISELFPPIFEIPISFTIPVDTQLVGVSTTGTPITFRVKDNVTSSTTIPITSAKAFGDSTIRIQKTLPVEAHFTSIVKVRTAYGTDLNKIIDKLEHLAQNGSG